MEQDHNTLQTQLIELNNVIETNREKLTLDALSQATQTLYSTISRIKHIRNSKIAINTLIPDVLYHIFTLAVYDSADPGSTTLKISHVCRHWRESAIGWPALWGFADLNKTRSFLELCMDRSSNAPLTLSYHSIQSTRHRNSALSRRDWKSSRLYLESCVLPRITSLTIHGTSNDFNLLQSIFQLGFGLLPLWNLDITCENRPEENRPETNLPLGIMQIDIRHLRQLRLEGVKLPLLWLASSPNKLTHFSLRCQEPPPLSLLVEFLSVCSLLNELDIQTVNYVSQDIIKPKTLNFPNLRRLILVPDGRHEPSCHYYIQCLSACIGKLDHLSQFQPKYPEQERRYDCQWQPHSHFAGHHYLFVYYKLGRYRIVSTPEWSSVVSSPDLVYFSGEYDKSTNPFATLEPVHQLPFITYLVLRREACKLLTSPNVDFCRIFPCLATLRLSEFDGVYYDQDVTGLQEKLSLLPVNLNLKTFVVECDYPASSSKFLLGMVSRIETEVLKLVFFEVHASESEFVKSLVDAWRMKSVSVLLLTWKDDDHYSIDWDHFEDAIFG